ncbi:MAG: site-specific DNA-methyltransferase [Planctomycetota bacterium]
MKDYLNKIIVGDVRDKLKELPDQSVHCVITSPPYYGLRDYKVPPLIWGGDSKCRHIWKEHKMPPKGGHIKPDNMPNVGANRSEQEEGISIRFGYTSISCVKCNAWRGSLGLEPTPELYVAHLVEIFREVKRVLRDDGTFWLNIGDSYAGSGGAHKENHANPGISNSYKRNGVPHWGELKQPCNYLVPEGCKPKDLIGIPWMLAFACRADGWYLRSDIIWYKRNPMPESVTDRPTKSHEYIFLLAKSEKYYYDNEAIKEKSTQNGKPHPTGQKISPTRNDTDMAGKTIGDGISRNKRSVWDVTTHPFRGAHFATFPIALIEPMVLAGSSEKGVCSECGAPWARIIESKRLNRTELSKDDIRYRPNIYNGSYGDINGKSDAGYTETKTTGWRATCQCKAGVVPAVVLDPFMGAGTTAVAAKQLHRNFIGIELNPDYIGMAEKRIKNTIVNKEIFV